MEKKNFFNNQLKGKIKTENFQNLKDAFKKILIIIKNKNLLKKQFCLVLQQHLSIVLIILKIEVNISIN